MSEVVAGQEENAEFSGKSLADVLIEESPTQEQIRHQLSSSEMLKPENLKVRVDEALERCDFITTPELKTSVEGFYADHYGLASDVESLLKEDPHVVESDVAERRSKLEEIAATAPLKGEELQLSINSIIEHGNMPPAICNIIRSYMAIIRLGRLDNPDDSNLERAELMLMAKAVEALFNEPSVAVTTVGDKERSLIKSVASEVLEKADSSGMFDKAGKTLGLNPPRYLNTSLLKNPLLVLNGAQETFWKDTRYAGQLLFHSSSEMLETRGQGKIMPRRMQRRAKGEFHAATAGELNGHIHSPTTHWSELYDSAGYKGGGRAPGTIAMPLWEIIKAAPYGRDAEYGVLRIKPDRRAEADARVPIADGAGDIGVGGPDFQGKIGTDRTFYVSAHDVPAEAPIETAPDGYVLEQSPFDYAVTVNDKEVDIAGQSGLGEGFPQLHNIDDLDWTNSPEAAVEREQTISDDIKSLQHESIDRWPDQIVVPVRASGVLDFYVPDDDHLEGRPRAQFTRVQAA
ncbi:MAG TPA: hypothetical protein VLE72_03965 [Candidatus Saccharimonadales bacterium]|nr:hypothetical protein [Candidatus Saccharimonadales bacterium]